MSTRICRIAILTLAVGELTVRAASLPGSLSVDSLGTAPWLANVVVGVDVEQAGRTVDLPGGMEDSLDVLVVSAFVGYDLNPAVTLFGTIGGTDNQHPLAPDQAGGSNSKWSLGANWNLAEYTIRQPSLLTGDRLTVKLLAEFASYEAKRTDWIEYSLALPIAYELIEGGAFAPGVWEDRFVLSVYVGPMLSHIDGDLGTNIGKQGFEEAQTFGLVGGVDLFLTRYVSLGAHVSLFDTDDEKTSAGGSFRYHF